MNSRSFVISSRKPPRFRVVVSSLLATMPFASSLNGGATNHGTLP